MELADKLKTLNPSPLDMADPDECCGGALAKALRSGELARSSEWTHAKCGCRWAARQMGDGSRFWYPVVEVWII
jgi:hypothetical protein